MSDSKNHAIVLAVTEGGMSIPEAAIRFTVSTRWIRVLLARYRAEGLAGVESRSRRPHSSPHAVPPAQRAQILLLRERLVRDGLDAGAESIRDRLPPDARPAASTIWRILRSAGRVSPQPQKRPRSSWQRFEADAPNETWQSDFTHWSLADGTDSEIISWLDDHSRKLLHISPHTRITGAIVVDSFTRTADAHGLPASTLTDNGLVYTARFARGNSGGRAQPNAFEQLLADLGIDQKNGAANHPTTQGKIERFHQTLKRWLAAQPHPARDLDELHDQLTRFQHVYNTERPHRAVGRRTPEAAYAALPKAAPTAEIGQSIWRVRYDLVGPNGTVTLRHQGRLRHLGIGRGRAGTRVIVLVHKDQTMVIARRSGEIIAEHVIDPGKAYQARQAER